MPSTPKRRRCSSCFFVSVRSCRSSSEAEFMFDRITGFIRIDKIHSCKSFVNPEILSKFFLGLR